MPLKGIVRDQINATRFRPQSRFDNILGELNRGQIARAAGDPDFQALLENIEVAEDLRKQKAVSLNLETRQEEQKERRASNLARENARRTARGLEQLESLENVTDEDQPDVLLNQAAEILTDLVAQSASQSAVLTDAVR